jgi:predicted TIM-barrel fold metal-dependent hydrolase
MRVTSISSVNFLGKIIDSHTHVGTHDGGIYTKQDLDVFVKSELPNKDTIEKMFVSDLDVLHSVKGEYEGNKAVLDMFKDSSKYELFASCSPKDGDISNIKRLFEENPNKFIGLKFHPDIQELDLSDKKYEPYMEFASEKNLPCLFHSQVDLVEGGKLDPNKIHISDPENIYAFAKKYHKTPVVMAHLGSGYNEAHDKTIDVLVKAVKNGDANLYADISWVDIDSGVKDGHKTKDHIIKAIKKLKGIGDSTWEFGDQSYRLMFGTDAPLARFKEKNSKKSIQNYTEFVEDIKYAIKTDKDLSKDADKIIDDLFYNNAKKLYLSTQKKNKTSYKKYTLIALPVIAFLGALFYLNKTKNDKNQKAKKVKNF